ncbi:uncharacterized protein LOC6537403 isoform X2 [Drosophila yakuba]|uniref:Uncharacterized protein, isoform A n=1 Tax=Drosophila yakuba TaxID=7245 RepID=B4PU21_DROYA|nr:uncharacterized protein LOC6537403 isoform X2 [Drosophila yakuba]EDW97671.1 uncharacterized protein Dyak_GE24196, isoform A [Drosophila yakuba]
MDSTSASVVYANAFYAPNYPDTQQSQPQPQPPPPPPPQLQSQQQQHQSQMFHGSFMVRSALGSGLGLGLGPAPNPQASASSGLSPRGGMYSDLYRFEDGSGDASGSLLLGQEDDHYCGGEAEQQLGASTSSSCPTTSGESVSMDTEPEPEQELQMNQGELEERAEMNEMEDMEELAEEDTDQQRPPHSPCMGGNTSYMVFPRTAADYMPRLPLPRHCPYINIGQEQYVIQAETVFVLGMRLNVTKNDIILFFGKLGVIKMDESTNKPKIFVYKNKMTGRSKGEATITYVSPFSAQAAISCLSGAKFMGQVLTVLPAYLSTRRGSVRYSYPRELNSPEHQRRQRALKWKPASDNWVCMLCRNSNFVWRSSCNRCQADKVVAVQSNGASSWMGSGGGGAGSPRRWRPQRNDWLCKLCFNMNFWYRAKCNRCHASRSDETQSSESTEEEDTWELLLNPPCAE